MIIVYLHQYFKTPDQAGGTRSYEMAKRLAQFGHEVHIITSSNEGAKFRWQMREIEGFKVHSICVPYDNKMKFWQRIKAFVSFSLQSSKKAIAFKADVIFATSTPLTIVIPGYIASKFSRCPMVFEVRDLWPEIPIALGYLKNPLLKFSAKWLESFAYNKATKIVALSSGMARALVSRGLKSEKICTIPNSSDLSLFDPARLELGVFRGRFPEIGTGPIVLYPGTLGVVNDVSYLIDIAKSSRENNSDVKFVVVGEGAEKNKLLDYALSVGVLGKNFFIFSEMPKNDLVYAFRDAALIVSLVADVPELENNSANKFFDALASGTPIAINYKGWQYSEIQQHAVGLCLSRSIQVAVNQLSVFLSDPERVKITGERARVLAEQKYSRDILAKKLNDLLLNSVG